ncbi:hypothetical protein CTU88_14170 [Streptomyces sp. JV178]|nr:hypothetical protein CTU88_14170 [Streptomyces sp. JV178]
MLLSSAGTASPARGCVAQRRGPTSGAWLWLRKRGEVEFVLVVGVDQAVFHLGFAFGDLGHEVVVVGLALLVLGPVGVAEVSGAVQGTPWEGDAGVDGSART